MLDIAIAALFAAWLVASALAQVEALDLVRFDRLYLLPGCRFFAPKPVTHDMVVLVQAGAASPWRPLLRVRKSWVTVLWCPTIRTHKAQSNICDHLLGDATPPELRHLSYPYLVLLTAATGVARRHPAATHVRFILATYGGFEDSTLNVVFQSNEHALR